MLPQMLICGHTYMGEETLSEMTTGKMRIIVLGASYALSHTPHRVSA